MKKANNWTNEICYSCNGQLLSLKRRTDAFLTFTKEFKLQIFHSGFAYYISDKQKISKDKHLLQSCNNIFLQSIIKFLF